METNYRDTLKFVLSNALIHIDGISNELRKMGIGEKDAKDLDAETLKRARMLDTFVIAINDIIHPAHKLLEEYFSDSDKAYFDILKQSHQKAREIGMLFKGCGCPECIERNKIVVEKVNTVNPIVNSVEGK